jgi:hypothetical protein
MEKEKLPLGTSIRCHHAGTRCCSWGGMKRRLESEHEVKREATGPGSGAGSGPGLGAAAAMSDEMKHMVAALVAKELLAGLTPGSGQGGARFGSVAFGDEQEATVNAFLHQKLGNDSLTRRPGPGGKRLTYIESCKAIELANRAFGFNGWSCHIIDCHEEYVRSVVSALWLCMACAN